MPREIVHWHILDRATEKAGPLKALGPLLVGSQHLTYLGTMTPDAPYYHSYGKDEVSNTLGELIHGRDGEDTFQLVNAVIRNLQQTSSERLSPLWSFIAGYLSHCAVDIIFHPWVFYVTGDYYHASDSIRREARIKHRRFEVFLDSWFRARKPCRGSIVLKDHLKAVGSDLNEITKLLGNASSVYVSSTLNLERIDGIRRWRAALRDMAIHQFRFLSDRWGVAVSLLNLAFPQVLTPIEALCSYRRRNAEHYFDGVIEFKNPVSGEATVTSIETLIEDAVSLTLSYWRELEQCIISPVEFPRLTSTGPSLNYGLVGAHHSQALCYSTSEIILPGLNS